MAAFITIKSVAKDKPADQPRVQIDDKIFAFQSLQQVLSQAANATGDAAYTVQVNAVDALPADAAGSAPTPALA